MSDLIHGKAIFERLGGRTVQSYSEREGFANPTHEALEFYRENEAGAYATDGGAQPAHPDSNIRLGSTWINLSQVDMDGDGKLDIGWCGLVRAMG